MRKINFLSLLSALLIISANILQAQNITSQKGLKIIEFGYPEGKLKVYLPDDIRPGETVSGTIKAEPEGKNDKQKKKALDELLKRTLKIGNRDDPKQVTEILLNRYPGEAIPIKLESAPAPLTVSLYNNNKPEQSAEIKTTEEPSSKITTPGNCLLPTHALTGSPVRIRGTFDGDISNTKCSVDSKPAEILAESPRQTIISYPADAGGTHIVSITEKGNQLCENKVSGVQMDLSAGRLNLLKGEKTYVDVNITGLQNLPSDATLTVTNLTTGVVTMIGGENQLITLPPADISSSGTFNKRFDLQSVKTGSFSVNVDLDLPDPPSSSAPETNWVACNLGTVTCILPEDICEKLHNDINNLPSYNIPASVPPQPDPIYNTTFESNPVEEDEPIISQALYLNTGEINGAAFGFQKINEDPTAAKDTLFTDIDSIATDGFKTEYPSNLLKAGVYNNIAVAYYGNNQQVMYSSVIVIPSQPQRPSVSNEEVERLKKKERELRDSINNINRRIQQGTNRVNDNYRREHVLDSLRWVQQQLQYQLHRIDEVVEQIPGTYGPKLKSLLDSLDRFNKKVNGLNRDGLQEALDKMKDEVKKLEDALKACRDHLAALQQEQKDLEEERKQIENDQQQAYRDILQAMRDAGYNPAGFSGRDKNTGKFKYRYGLVMRGSGGDYEIVNGIPAQALKKVSELEKKLKDLENRHQQVLQRQKEMPGEIEDARNECDRLEGLLAKAKAAQKKGANALTEYNYNMADLDELCREIKELLQPLVNWCKSHPGECASFEVRLKTLMDDCPGNINSLPGFMDRLNGIIESKGQKEEQHSKEAEKSDKQIKEIEKENQDIRERVNDDEAKGQDYGSKLGKAMNDVDRAIGNEIARRQQAEREEQAALKRVCIEFLRSQAKSQEEEDMIEEIGKIKDQMQQMGEDIKKASGLGDKITKDKLKELTDKLRDNIDKMLEQFEKFDKLKEKIDEWKEIKDDLETLMKDNKSAKEGAEAMGVVLKRIHEKLEDVANTFPILKLFTAYFGFMVEAFNAITSKGFEIVQGYIAKQVEMALAKTNCLTFINEYEKNHSVDDVVRKANEIFERFGTSATTDTPERRRMLAEELRKYVIKQMTDCCLKYAIQ